MRIGIIRHAKVFYRDPFFSTGKKFDQSRLMYNASPVLPINLKISVNEFPLCYVSSMTRARDTVTQIYDGNFIISNEIIEISNSAFWLRKISIPTFLRSSSGRIAWLLNYSKMPETRLQSNQRARKFLTSILNENKQNTLLVTHGFFMQSLRHELRQLGFKGYCPFLPPNGKFYIFERK
ncbi:MAG: histidine phosphatase family protein [Chitinophagales bacterium]|nr:histidine phosphatase family protein [Chitinophagales bacterium]